MNTVFISSVVGEFQAFRQAARNAVELMGHKPVMCEDFPARPYSSETACAHEVEQSDIYVLILGAKYGFETVDGISVTCSEFRTAKAANKPVISFIQNNVDMEPRQLEFKNEVEEYHDGVFRAQFTSPEELKDEIIKSLRHIETMSQAMTEKHFNARLSDALDPSGFYQNDDPELILAFMPQPERLVDIVGIEKDMDNQFRKLCDAGITQFRDGYKLLDDAHWTGMKSGKIGVYFYADGLVLLSTNPTLESEGLFSGYFAPADNIERIAKGFKALIQENSGFVHIALRNMENTYVAPLPSGNSLTMRMFTKDTSTENSRLFVPLTTGSYESWIEDCIKRFARIYRYK